MTYFHQKSKYDNFPETEVEFFELIKKYCKVIFDVGCRDDIDYLKKSFDESREFHLFDPDVNFITNIENQISNLPDTDDIENVVYLNAYGLGKESGVLKYYENTQSFVFRKNSGHALSQDNGTEYEIKTLDEYCAENSINEIDFLKVDIEGMEYDFFQGGENTLKNNTKIIQFEFASTMIDQGVDPDELVGWFDSDTFNLYLQRVDPRHPYYSENKKMITELDETVYGTIKSEMILGSGCNLIAIRKDFISDEFANDCF